MKRIYLAPKGKRILARLIDFLIVVASTVIFYFSAIYTTCFDINAYQQYNIETSHLYRDSGLYLVTDDACWDTKGHYASYITSVSELSNATFSYRGKIFSNNNLLKDLYIYYTTLHHDYSGEDNLSLTAYKNSILKVGNASSNIASFDETDYSITLIDDTKGGVTINYFMAVYYEASIIVDNSGIVKNSKVKANQLIINVLLLLIPVFAGFSLIFEGLIPLFSKYGQTIGKYIFHFVVLDKDGYKANRFIHLWRWLILFLEYTIAIATFGSGILIPYTTFLFSKKRQALHDMLARTVVIDGARSIFFDTREEERFCVDRLQKTGDLIEDEKIDLDRISGKE